MVHGSDVPVEFCRQAMDGGTAGQGASPCMGPDRDLGLPAVYVVKDDGGHPVACRFKTGSGIFVHGAVTAPDAAVEFHIGEDIDDLGHFRLGRSAFYSGIQNEVKNGLQICAASPGKTSQISEPVRHGISLERNQMGSGFKGDETVMKNALAALCTVDAHGL